MRHEVHLHADIPILEGVSRRQLEQATEEYHRANPLERGIAIPMLRSVTRADAELVDAALGEEVADGRLRNVSGLVSLAGWSPTPSVEQISLLETLVSQLEGAGAEPPTVEELAVQVGVDPAPLLRYLERTGGRVVQVEQNRYYALGPLEQMVRRLEGVMAGGAERSPAELRELLGLSRKYLIPFLEYCDRVGHTHRTAGGRVWNGVVNRDGPVK